MITSLKSVLNTAAGDFLKAGGSASTGVKRALREHREKEYRLFLFLSGAVITGLILCLVVLFATNSQQMRVVGSVIGIGSGGGLEMLRRLWKDWSQTDLLLILIEDANEAQVTRIVNRLVKKL